LGSFQPRDRLAPEEQSPDESSGAEESTQLAGEDASTHALLPELQESSIDIKGRDESGHDVCTNSASKMHNPEPGLEAPDDMEEEVIVDEDGFRYKRRKRRAQIPAALPEEQSVENVSDLPDYPNLCTDANELYMPPSDADSTNDEILMAIADQVCTQELALAQATFSCSGHQFVPAAVEETLAEFQLKIEELLVEGSLMFSSDADSGEALQFGGSELEKRKAALQTLLIQLKEEEAQWSVLESECAEGPTDADASDGADPTPQLPETVFVEVQNLQKVASQVRADVEATGMEGAMQKAYADAHKTLTLRIDALGALVRSAEDSCHRAETIGRRVAASADQVAFQGLPHMASPHRLIRRLTAGHPTAALTH